MTSLVLHSYIEAYWPITALFTALIGCLVLIWRDWHPERHPAKLFAVGFTIVCLLLWHERALRGCKVMNRYVMFSNDGPLGSQMQNAAEDSIRPQNAADYAIILLVASFLIFAVIYIWQEGERE